MSSIAFYNGTSGMRAFQNALDVTAHNIANVNTFGYKARRPAFDDLLRTRINTNVTGEHLVGHGVKQEYVDQLMAQSSITLTDFVLDFAIAGEGFFAVDNDGQREYTRAGDFDLSIEGDTATLVTNDGSYVLDRNGARITLTADEDGLYNTDEIADRLGVFGFANPYGLIPQNNARFTESDNSGAAVLLEPDAGEGQTYTIMQNAVEASGVDLGQEMLGVINAQRAFQLNSRVVQTADQMADLLNNLR